MATLQSPDVPDHVLRPGFVPASPRGAGLLMAATWLLPVGWLLVAQGGRPSVHLGTVLLVFFVLRLGAAVLATRSAAVTAVLTGLVAAGGILVTSGLGPFVPGPTLVLVALITTGIVPTELGSRVVRRVGLAAIGLGVLAFASNYAFFPAGSTVGPWLALGALLAGVAANLGLAVRTR